MEDIAETEARLLTMRMNAEMALICGNLVAPDVHGVYPHWPHDAYAAEAKKTSRVIGSASHSMSRAERGIVEPRAPENVVHSPGNLPYGYRSAMHGQGCRKPGALKLAERIQDSCFIGNVPDQTTQVGRMELAVRNWRGLHLFQ